MSGEDGNETGWYGTGWYEKCIGGMGTEDGRKERRMECKDC